MRINDDDIINKLTMFGITKYEAKAYLSLLRTGESYGGKISKLSN